MRRMLSWKRLLIVTGILLAVGGATYAVHKVQVRRQASSLKERAEQVAAAAETNPKQLAEAIDLYEQYLKFRPADEAAYLKYITLVFAQTKAEPRNTERAADAAEGFLRRFPDHPEERRKLIELCIKLGRLNTARQHIQTLFDSPKGDFDQDVDLLEKMAAVEINSGNVDVGLKLLAKAIKTDRATVQTYEEMLTTLSAHPTHKEFKIEDYLLELRTKPRFEKDIPARVLVVRYYRRSGSIDQARKDLAVAAAMPGGADSPDVLLAGAELDLEEAKGTPEEIKQKLAAARIRLEKAFASAPKDVRIGLLLSDVHRRQGEFAKAADVLIKTTEALGEPNDAFFFVVDRLIDYGERAKATELADRLARDGNLRVIVNYFRGRLAALAGEWEKARELLEEVTPRLERLREYHKKAATELGLSYEKIQNPDKQLLYCNLALADDRLYVPAMVGKADALIRLGRFRDALPLLTVLVNRYQIDAFRPKLARLELLAALSQPANARNWEVFEAALGPPESRTVELKIVQAEGLAARGDVAEATKILTELTTADPKNVAALVTLARLRDGGRPETAFAAIEAAEKQVGDIVELRLAKARVLAARVKRPTPNDFRALGADADKFPESDRHRLWFGVGEAATRVAETTADPAAAGEMRAVAIDYFVKAAGLKDAGKYDLQSRGALIDLGLADRKTAVVADALKEIRDIEGPNGPMFNLAEVAIGLPKIHGVEEKEKRAADIKNLRDKANKARAARPGWSRVYFALAQLDELEGLNDSALTNYQEAIKLGDRQEYVIRKAVELFRERKQDGLAVALLNTLHNEGPLPDDLERYRAIHDLLARNIPKSERATIDRVAPTESKDYRVQLLRGALLAAIREDDEALVAFRRAVELGDNVPETWTTLVTHLVRQQKYDEATAAVAQAGKKLQTNQPPTERGRADLLMAIAGCHELLGDLKAAGDRYRQARDAAPTELNPNRQYVLFLQRAGDKPEADKLLRQLAQSPAQDQARWARRHLALTLVVGPNGYARRAAALKLIDENLAAAPTDPEDVKAKAVVQTVDPVTREEGMNTLVEFARWNDLTPDEFYLLARLYFDGGKTDESVAYFEAAARPRPGLTPEHLAGLIRVCVAKNLMPRALAALDRLKVTFPASWEAAAEDARVLVRQAADADKDNRPAEATKLRAQALDRVLRFPGAETAAFIPGRTGPLLADLRFDAEAEALYRRYIDLAKDDGAHLPLALFLINKKRTAEAIELARKYEGRCSAVVTARVLTGSVWTKDPGPDVVRQVEDWLKEKLTEYQGKPEYAALLGCRAELLDARGRYDDAIAEYRKAIGVQKSDLLVNNLCMLLALHHKSGAEVNEAIRMMTELIGIRGPDPAYLDTRAVCYILNGRPEDAVKDLDLALIQRHRPAQLFHLAWAYNNMTDRRAQTGPAYARAVAAGLTEDDLHPLEREKLKELRALLKLPPK